MDDKGQFLAWMPEGQAEFAASYFASLEARLSVLEEKAGVVVAAPVAVADNSSVTNPVTPAAVAATPTGPATSVTPI